MLLLYCDLTGEHMSLCAQAIVHLHAVFSVLDTSGVGGAGEPGGQLPARAAAISLCSQGIPAVRAQLEGVGCLPCSGLLWWFDAAALTARDCCVQSVLPIRLKFGLAPPAACAQSWAKMEEDLGFLQRADDLRRYSIEEQQEVRSPAGL